MLLGTFHNLTVGAAISNEAFFVFRKCSPAILWGITKCFNSCF